MGSESKRKDKVEIIKLLAERYPHAFNVIPHKVVPLIYDIDREIFIDLGRVPVEFKRRIGRAIFWYRNWPSYLQSVAFGEHTRNLAGHRMDRPSIPERESARNQLKERGLWTKRMDMVFKVNMGRKEAANR